MGEKEQLFEDIKKYLTDNGYTLTEIEGTRGQYAVQSGKDNVGELMAGYDGRNNISDVYFSSNGNYHELTSMREFTALEGNDFEFIPMFIDDEPTPGTLRNEGDIAFDVAVEQELEAEEGDVPFDVATEQALEAERLASERTEGPLGEENTATAYETFQADLIDMGYELTPLDEGNAFIARLEGRNVGAFMESEDGRITDLSLGDYKAKGVYSAEQALEDYKQSAKDIKDEIEQIKDARNKFLSDYKDGFGIMDEDGHSKMLSAHELEGYMDEKGIEGTSVQEYIDKTAEELSKELEKELAEPVKGQELINEFRKDINELNESNKKENEMDGFNVTADMSEKEMAKAAIDYINDGKEMDERQAAWIEGFDDGSRKASEVIGDEIDSLNEERSALLEGIRADEAENEKLASQLGRQIAIAKMNDCPVEDVEGMRAIVDNIKNNNIMLNAERLRLAEVEKAIEQKAAEFKEALKGERKEAVRGFFAKAQDTLKQGVKLGLNTMGKMKQAMEKVNLKVIDSRDTKEKVSAYKDLSKQINDINVDYCRKMEVVKNEYNLNREDLEDLEKTFTRRAELRGAIKDVGLLLTGREAKHEVKLTAKEQAELTELRSLIQKNKLDMESLNISYERTIAPKLEEIKDFGKAVEEKGRDTGDIFSARLSRIHAENADRASSLRESSEKILSGNDKKEAKTAGGNER